MQKKLNEDFIDDYCEKFASKVTAEFFSNGKEVITGKEILKVTPSKQVNFFVIKLLFRYWQEETKKLESPFFNYKHDEVRQAMIQFMNVLSQHIEINREKFETLLNHAVKDTLYLAAMPQAYVEIDLDSRGIELIKEKTVEGTVKYLKIHKQEIQNFMSDMKGLTIDDVIDELPEEFEDFDTTEAVSEECKLLSKVLEITVDKIFSDDPNIDEFDEDDLFAPGEEDLVDERPVAKKTAPDAQAESEGVEISKEDEAMSEEDIQEEEAQSNQPEEEDEEDDIPQSQKEEEEPEEDEEEEEPKKEVRSPVMLEDDDREDDFPEETINKQFEKEEETLAEHHEKAPQEGSILSLISLNHRYMFIKDLFRNDKDEFEKALVELEGYDSFDASVEFLVQGYAKHNEWDMQSDEVKEFLKVLFRRFR
ncbi:hypothetical protein SAMN05421640_0423 [Ekhidna lutea]|uniref:Uncharacterized protein n=1 Tax=Ekhidna lutea TaxID=447679 RepID=A0A239F1C0_EKHLU|nr:hypothetical protein [Ekhidna lutea]SNS50338.1 hypothetical protein SAMN05421640_0423 [Ekhidna lutea]